MKDPVGPLLIRSGQGDYEVEFPSSRADVASRLTAFGSPLFVFDRRVFELHGTVFGPALAGHAPLLLDATEETKTPAGVAEIASWLQSRGAAKKSLLVAIGGGIVQDVATFTAHVYYRGIRWLFVPTTLLSMSDSCIGAKCGINLGLFKNQLGVFHAPSHVLVCSEFLETLGDAEVESGHGEILKLMLTGSREDFTRYRDAVDRSGPRGPEALGFVRRSLEVKRAVIEADEYEKGPRKILNFGHTFGHALEALTGHAVPHGTAVAWGIDLANFLSFRRGLLAESTFREVHDFVARHFTFPSVRPVPAEELVAAVRHDKKASAGIIELILLRHMGGLEIVPVPIDRGLEDDVREYLTEHDVLRRD